MSTARVARQRVENAIRKAAVGAAVVLLMAVAAPTADAAATDPKPQFGIASVYARMLDGRTTASGERHDSDDFTAAHRSLPLGSEVRVTNLANHRSTVVRINDRGPQVKSRIIDLSPRAANAIGLRARGKGLARVRIDVLKLPAEDAQPAGAPDDRSRRKGSAEGAPSPSLLVAGLQLNARLYASSLRCPPDQDQQSCP